MDNKSYKLITRILIFSIVISIIGLLFQMKKNSDKTYYFSNNASIPEIQVEKESAGKYRTVVVYDTVYEKQKISGTSDAVALIKKDSNIQKQKCNNTSISNIESRIEKKYSIDAVNLCELDEETLTSIENVLNYIFKEFPSTKGYITNLALVNQEDTTGYIVAFMPSFAFASSNTLTTYPTVKKTQVLFNASYFLNKSYLKSSIKNAAKSGWFVPNANTESLVAHEFGHYLSFLISVKESNMDSILVVKQGKFSTYNKMLSDYTEGKIAQELIKEAYENYKKDTGANISLIDFRSSISEYAVAVDDKGEYIYDETIAEAMDDCYANGENASDASKYIINVVKEKIKGI